MTEQDDIFYNGDYMLRTVPLEGIRIIKTISRKCKTCGEYNKGECFPVGIIANPDCPYCSFYKDKEVKLNNIRTYGSLK